MLMLALLADDVQNRDPFLTDEVTSHLFAENPPHGLGTDLAALNIQRGREHGIPGQCRPNHSLANTHSCRSTPTKIRSIDISSAVPIAEDMINQQTIFVYPLRGRRKQK